MDRRHSTRPDEAARPIHPRFLSSMGRISSFHYVLVDGY